MYHEKHRNHLSTLPWKQYKTKRQEKLLYKQNYLCKDCRRQFLKPGDYQQNGRRKDIPVLITRMLARGCAIRDIRAVLCVSFAVIYKVITGLRYDHKPLRDFYDVLEIDEFWTYVGRKGHKVWLIYAYHRRSGEMVAHVWGKRDTRTAEKLRRRLVRLGVRYGAIATDSWDSFEKVSGGGRHLTGKQYTKGIEGNNCRLRHRNRRFFRKTCCFSKKLRWHWKVFAAVLFYINFGRFLVPAYIS